MRPVFQIKGRIVQEDASANPASVRVQLRGSGSFGSVQTTANSPDGKFTLTRIATDNYTLAFNGLGDNVFVRSARFGELDVLNSTLRIDREPTDTLEIVLSRKTATLDAVVLGRDQKASPATTVVLVPDSSQRHRFELYRAATTDGAGRATLTNIAPGNYKLFAWVDIETNAWQNAEVIRQFEDRGTVVTIGENEIAKATVTAIE